VGWLICWLVCVLFGCWFAWLVGFWDGGLVGGFQLRDDDGTALTDLPLQRNLVTILQEGGWAPGAIWTGAENLLPTPQFSPQTIQVVAGPYTHVMKLRELRYTSTPPSPIGHQWLTRPCQINPGKEPRHPFTNSWVGPTAGLVSL
jgi:hypothetical protein